MDILLSPHLFGCLFSLPRSTHTHDHPELWPLTCNALHYSKFCCLSECSWNSTYQISHWLPYTSCSNWGHINCTDQVVLVVKSLPANARDLDAGSVPGLGRAPGEGDGNPLQYSCLRSPWTEEPGELQSVGYKELDMTEWLHFYTFYVFWRKIHLLRYRHKAQTSKAVTGVSMWPNPGQQDVGGSPGSFREVSFHS